MINLIQTILSILCLCIGFYFGFKIAKTKELPKVEINPIKVADKIDTEIQTIKKKKEQKKSLNELNLAMQNMERFDGSSSGQKPIKK